MGKWFSEKKAIFSPKQIVIGFKTGENSVTYRSVKPEKVEKNDKYYNSPVRKAFWEEDDYVRPVPVFKKEKKYAWEPKKWSNFSFESFYNKEDDDSFLIVKEPLNYITPNTSDITMKAAVYTSDKIRRVKELARVCYFKMIGQREYLIDKYLDPDNISNKIQAKITLYNSIYDTFIPGYTPLEQAIYIHFQLADKEAKANKQSTKSRQNFIAEFKRDTYADSAITDQIDMNPYNQEKKFGILNNISLMGNFGSEFIVEKETGEKQVNNSNFFKKKILRDYSQFNQIEMYQRILPNFQQKFLTKNLTINCPVQRSERKQIIIIILDFSGSMNNTTKQKWVNAILMDRFRYVIKGEAEVYFSYFISSSELRFIHVKNKEDVESFWKQFSNYPSGGATDLKRVVESISDNVKNKSRFFNLKHSLSNIKPEILIINDGQDSVGTKVFPYKVNAISLVEFSDELKSLCIDSGGKQIRINGSGKITAYSKTETKELN